MVASDFSHADYMLMDIVDVTNDPTAIVGDFHLVSNTWFHKNDDLWAFTVSMASRDGLLLNVITVKYSTTLYVVYVACGQPDVSTSPTYAAAASYSHAKIDNYLLTAPAHLYNTFMHIDVVDTVSDRIEVGSYHELISRLSALPSDKISQDHHHHYRATEILAAVWSINPGLATLAVNKILHISDVNQAAAAGILLWLLSIDSDVANLLLRSQMFLTTKLSDFYQVTKNITMRFKHMANIVPVDLWPLFEAEVLVNRRYADIDWYQEKLNRTQPQLAMVPGQTVYDCASQMFAVGRRCGKKYLTLSWDQFWRSRWEWSTTGAVYTQHPDLAAKIRYKSRHLKNKFIAINTLDNNMTLRQFLEAPPCIYARPSSKYEWGKVRAIYGTDLLSYILFEFVFAGCEERFSNDIPIGRSANKTHIQKLTNRISIGGVSYCLDFEDFNSQHSVESMYQVLRAYVNVHRPRFSADQLAAAEWCLKAVHNQYVAGSSLCGGTYKTNGTLFSGWRLTTFVNTVLNYVYCKVIFNDANVVCYGSLHSGDDVFTHIKTVAQVQAIIRSAKKFNIRLSLTKCSLMSVAEFLRVDHRHGSDKQYLARNISTVVHGRTESQQHGDVIEALKSNETRLCEYLERGGPTKIHSQLVKTYVHKLTQSDSFGCPDKKLIEAVMNYHPVFGGINEDDRKIRNDKIEISVSVLSENEYPTNLPGVNSYVDLLKVLLENPERAGPLHDAINTATKRVCYSMKRQVTSITPCDSEERRSMRALYKLYKDYKLDKNFGKARLIGLGVVSRSLTPHINQLLTVIGDRENFYEWLTVLV